MTTVYIFEGDGESSVCCACPFVENGYGQFIADSTEEMVDHLQQHIDAGHQIPVYGAAPIETFHQADARAEAEANEEAPPKSHIPFYPGDWERPKA
jgi:hypothetical protein